MVNPPPPPPTHTPSHCDLCSVPQQGSLSVKTEFGRLEVAPNEILVVQQGQRFSVAVGGPSRGYILEVFGSHFQLPQLGPIGESVSLHLSCPHTPHTLTGANGLANARDFLSPVAWYEDKEELFTIVSKFQGSLFSVEQVSCTCLTQPIVASLPPTAEPLSV